MILWSWTGPNNYVAQEKPDLPQGAAGAEASESPEPPVLTHPEDIIFFISGLSHFVHVTDVISEEDRISSNSSPHVLHVNS